MYKSHDRISDILDKLHVIFMGEVTVRKPKDEDCDMEQVDKG